VPAEHQERANTLTSLDRVPHIETARLVLRSFTLGDVEDVYDYAHTEAFWRYLPNMPRSYTREVAAAFLGRATTRDLALQVEWAIEFEGHAIGAINVRPQRADRRASMGYGIGPAHWGRGIMTEAARAVVDWAFAHLEIDRVFATADARNIGSWGVMRHLGMQHEGTLRQHRMQDGVAADEVVYGILRNEWGAAGAAPLPAHVRPPQ
jgi:ribosomal-protein-alanine N-acetyltransferase